MNINILSVHTNVLLVHTNSKGDLVNIYWLVHLRRKLVVFKSFQPETLLVNIKKKHVHQTPGIIYSMGGMDKKILLLIRNIS